MSKALDSVLNVREEFWDIPYLMGRYGVSRSTLTGTFFAYGIPKEKVGTKYLFLSTEVVLWEITCRYVPFGRKDRIVLPACIVLPAFKEYSGRLIDEIRESKKKKNSDESRKLVEEGMYYGVDLYSEMIKKIELLALFILTIALMLWAWR